MSRRRVVVFGAGAAGLAAAVSAAEQGAEVILVEKTQRAGRKLSMTGNGRCNLTNLTVREDDYNEGARETIRQALSLCGVSEVVTFFRDLGLFLRAEGSFIYPVSGSAASVVSVLVSAAEHFGVQIEYGQQLKDILPGEKSFTCRTSDREYSADAVILATGGLAGPKSLKATGDAYYLCEKLGMKLTPRYPSLCPLLMGEDLLTGERGVRVWGSVALLADGKEITSEIGEIQLTRGILSGIPVLQMSGAAARELARQKEVCAIIDLFPEYDEDVWQERIAEIGKNCADESLIPLLDGIGNHEIGICILRRLGLSPAERYGDLSEQDKQKLWHAYRAFSVPVRGVGEYERAQVTAGGVCLSEIDGCFACRKLPGLYLAGELLDVDGRCGGFNLQWAFMSGILAGRNAASAGPAPDRRNI